LYSLSDIRVNKYRNMRWTRYVACMGEMRSVYIILVGKSEGKIPLWRPGRRWKESINTNLNEIWRKHVNWLKLAQSMVQWGVLNEHLMYIRVP